MKLTQLGRVAVIAAAALVPAIAFGQDAAGTSAGSSATDWAAGFDAGPANAVGDDDFDADPAFSAYLENFWRPRLSWRAMLSVQSFDGQDLPPGFRDPNDLDLLIATGNIVHTWDGGRVAHPFVTGGVGLYDYDTDFGDDEVEVGLNVGGGANLQITNSFAIKLEGDFHGTTGEQVDSLFAATAGARWVW